MIDRRYIHLIHKFTIPDWLFSNPTVTLDNVDISKETIMALCAGDVNASYTPPKRIMYYELQTTNYEPLTIDINKPFDIPVYLDDNIELGAMGIKLLITNYKLQIISINSDIEGLLFNIETNEQLSTNNDYQLSTNNYQQISIAWSAEDEGYSITSDKPLFYIKAIYKGEPNLSGFRLPASSFQITSESELADIDANLINIDKLAMPEISIIKYQLSIINYPNPFNNITNINYVLPEDANVKLNLYNVLGQKIAALVANERQQAGNHCLQYDGTNLKLGIYYCELRMENGEIKVSPLAKVKP